MAGIPTQSQGFEKDFRQNDGRADIPVTAAIVQTAQQQGQALKVPVCRLPQNGGAISCALSAASVEGLAPGGELADRRAFEETTASLLQTAKATGQDLELALVDMAGLEAAREEASPDQRDALERRVPLEVVVGSDVLEKAVSGMGPRK